MESLPPDCLHIMLQFMSAENLCALAQTSRFGNMEAAQNDLWHALFSLESWTSLTTQTLQNSLFGGNNSDDTDSRDFRALYRAAFLRERGAIVVELGLSCHKIGQCFWSAPRIVPRDVLQYTLSDLLCLDAEDETTIPSFLQAVTALVPSASSSSPTLTKSNSVISNSRDLTLLFVVPPFIAPNHTFLVFARRLLRSGCRRVRFESSSVCACNAHDVMNGVVLDLGWSRTTAVATVKGSIPRHIASFDEVTAQESGIYRPGCGGFGISRCLKEFLGNDVDVAEESIENFQRDFCYVRLVSTTERPPTENEIELASMFIVDRSGHNHEMAEARFGSTESLFRPSFSYADYEPLAREEDTSFLGIHDMVHRAVSLVVQKGSFIAPALRTELYSNIVLCGGCSALPGLDRRLRRELQRTLPSNISSHVVSGRMEKGRRLNAAWQGAAKLARAEVDDDMNFLLPPMRPDHLHKDQTRPHRPHVNIDSFPSGINQGREGFKTLCPIIETTLGRWIYK